MGDGRVVRRMGGLLEPGSLLGSAPAAAGGVERAPDVTRPSTATVPHAQRIQAQGAARRVQRRSRGSRQRVGREARAASPAARRNPSRRTTTSVTRALGKTHQPGKTRAKRLTCPRRADGTCHAGEGRVRDPATRCPKGERGGLHPDAQRRGASKLLPSRSSRQHQLRHRPRRRPLRARPVLSVRRVVGERAEQHREAAVFVTSKELDEETQLYYFGARYYDPRTSVWQSTDPALPACLSQGRVYFPIYLAVSSYGKQNPLRYVDPTGQENRASHSLRAPERQRVGLYDRSRATR